MEAKSSGHFAKGGAGYFAHNDRTTPTNNSIFSDEKNEVSCSSKEAFSTYRKELNKRSQAYSQRVGQKLQSNAVTHRSLIINLQANHKLENLKEISNYIEKQLDTKVLQVAIHRDEGHINEDGKAVKNYHAHIEIMGIDSLGFSIAQHQEKKKTKNAKDFTKTRTARLDSKFYREFQTILARSLGMERGKRNSKAKRLDTYDYKEHAKKQAEATQELKLTVTELKKAIEKQRKIMGMAGIYKKEDYLALQELKKSLNKSNSKQIYEEFIELKELLDGLMEERKQHKQIINKQQEEIEDLKSKIEELTPAEQEEEEIELTPELFDYDDDGTGSQKGKINIDELFNKIIQPEEQKKEEIPLTNAPIMEADKDLMIALYSSEKNIKAKATADEIIEAVDNTAKDFSRFYDFNFYFDRLKSFFSKKEPEQKQEQPEQKQTPQEQSQMPQQMP